MFFHEELFFEGTEGLHGDGNLGGPHGGEIGNGRLDGFEEFQAVGFLEPTGEGEVFHVAGKADAAADDDAGVGVGRGGGGRVALTRG